jgi:hypothetical protein
MARKGEKLIAAGEFETRLRGIDSKFESAATILDRLVHVQGGTYLKNPFIQVGVSATSPVTFDHAFKVGTVPHVVGNSNLATEMAGITDRDNTHFHFAIKYIDGSPGAGSLIWVAIGERA